MIVACLIHLYRVLCFSLENQYLLNFFSAPAWNIKTEKGQNIMKRPTILLWRDVGPQPPIVCSLNQQSDHQAGRGLCPLLQCHEATLQVPYVFSALSQRSRTLWQRWASVFLCKSRFIMRRWLFLSHRPPMDRAVPGDSIKSRSKTSHLFVTPWQSLFNRSSAEVCLHQSR